MDGFCDTVLVSLGYMTEMLLLLPLLLPPLLLFVHMLACRSRMFGGSCRSCWVHHDQPLVSWMTDLGRNPLLACAVFRDTVSIMSCCSTQQCLAQ